MMRSSIRSALLLGAAFIATGASPALAQGANEGDGTDIIVTARRVEERLQDVPISITVFNQAQIADRNIAIASDLAIYTPSLSINTRFGPEKAAFAIRGFNQDSSTGPTVGVYFADVISLRAQGGTTSGNTAAAGSFTDLQNVQVLKGPQGTLFGRNTTGGAVLLVPQKPTSDLEGYVEGTYGNYDQKRVQAAINVPLADTFKVRLAVDRNQRDGYMKNHSGIGPSAYNDVNYTYVRGSIVADLTPDLENYTVAYYSHSKTQGYALRFAACNPALAASTVATTRAVAGAACDQIARQAARGDSLTDVDVYQPDQTSGVLLNQWQVINTTTWRASDTMTVKNIVSYGEFRENSGFNLNSDNFFLPASFGPLAGQRIQYINLDSQPGLDAAAQSTFTEELQLQGGSADGRLNYVIGGYLEFARPMGWNQQRTAIFGNCSDAGTFTCQAPLGFVSLSQSRTQLAFDNHGLFAQATYKVTDQFSLTGGFRYTFDKTAGLSEYARFTLSPVNGVVVPVSGVCNDRVKFPTVNVLTQGTGACATKITAKSSKPTWLIDADFKPSEDILLYAKWARGYRQGGVNFTNPGLETWQPEKIDLYEIGAKTSFRGAVSGYFNVAAFYNDFRNQQVFAQSISGTPLVSGGNVVVNAGQSSLKGIEADAAITFFDSLKFDVGYTYLETKVKKIATEAELAPLLVGTPFIRLVPTSRPGDPLTYAPKHRLTVTATYTLPLDRSIGKLAISGSWIYTSSQFGAAPNTSPNGIVPGSNLFNANLNWSDVAGTPIDFALFAANVTNKKYITNLAASYFSQGFDSYAIGQPRMYGVRLRYKFGQ